MGSNFLGSSVGDGDQILGQQGRRCRRRELPRSHGANDRRRREGDSARRKPRARNKKNHGEIVWVHNFCFCQVNNGEPLEIDSFYLCHIYLGVGKLHVLQNIKCKTVGVALIERSESSCSRASSASFSVKSFLYMV
jgi:hypothetical protein